MYRPLLYKHAQEETIQLDEMKTLLALQSARGGFMGKPMTYWAEYITIHAQTLADRMSAEEFDDLNIEELGE